MRTQNRQVPPDRRPWRSPRCCCRRCCRSRRWRRALPPHSAAGRCAGPAGAGDPPDARRPARARQRHGLIPHPGRRPVEPGDGELTRSIAGDAFWTEPNAQAEIEVSASRIVDGPRHRTRRGDADRHDVPGEPNRRARSISASARRRRTRPTRCRRRAAWSRFAAPGRYGVVAGDTQTPTTVTVIEGSAQISGSGLSLQVGAQPDGDDQRQRYVPGRGRSGAA